MARVRSKRRLAFARGMARGIMARVIKICKIVSNAVARVISKRFLALARVMARVIPTRKIVRNSVARVMHQIVRLTLFIYTSFTPKKIIARRLKAVGSNVSRDAFEPNGFKRVTSISLGVEKST